MGESVRTTVHKYRTATKLQQHNSFFCFFFRYKLKWTRIGHTHTHIHQPTIEDTKFAFYDIKINK